MKEARRRLSEDNFLEIRYESFCDNPLRVIQAIAEFCELSWTSAFEARLKTYTVRSENHKWQEELTAEQQRALLGVTRSHLETYGYLSEERGAAFPPKPRGAAAGVGNVETTVWASGSDR